jgi:hypothetical protein
LKGAATRLPLPCARVDGEDPAGGRHATFLGTTEPRAARRLFEKSAHRNPPPKNAMSENAEVPLSSYPGTQ